MKNLLLLSTIAVSTLAASETTTSTTTNTTTITSEIPVTATVGVTTTTTLHDSTAMVFNSLVYQGMPPAEALARAQAWHPPMVWPTYYSAALPETKDNTK